MLEDYGVECDPIPSYHQQVDPVEQVNKTLKVFISMYVKSNHREWDMQLIVRPSRPLE